MGVPLVEVEVGGDNYKQSYAEGLLGLQQQHQLDAIVTGDMDLVGSMSRNWVEECCEAAGGGLKTFLPLWDAKRIGVLKSLAQEDFKIVFSCVKTPWFNAEWIGREITAEVLEQLQDLERAQGLDLGGERGEYHTMCLSGPLYRHPVELQSLEAEDLGANVKGKKDGDTWWALKSQEVQHSTTIVQSKPAVVEDEVARLQSIQQLLSNNGGRMYLNGVLI